MRIAEVCVVTALAAVLFTGRSEAASFDCEKATTSVERLICADPELSELDEELGQTYSLTLEASSNSLDLRKAQRDWLKNRDQYMLGDQARGSVADMYRSRIAELRALSAQKARAGFVPSKETIQKLIIGTWIDNIGPNPSNTRITKSAIWGGRCWRHYQLRDVQPRNTGKAVFYFVSLEFTSAGGPYICGHSRKSSFAIAMLPSDEVLAGKVTNIAWLICASAEDLAAAMNPLESNRCGSYVSDR